MVIFDCSAWVSGILWKFELTVTLVFNRIPHHEYDGESIRQTWLSASYAEENLLLQDA